MRPVRGPRPYHRPSRPIRPARPWAERKRSEGHFLDPHRARYLPNVGYRTTMEFRPLRELAGRCSRLRFGHEEAFQEKAIRLLRGRWAKPLTAMNARRVRSIVDENKPRSSDENRLRS